MFTFRGLLALFSAPRSALDAALRDLAHGKPERALTALESLLKNETRTEARAEIANKRGVALVALHRRDEARAAFESALDLLPGFAQALVNLGNLELEADRVELAIAYYERAIESDPQHASAHRHLALAFRRSGRTAEALAAFSRARRLEGRANAKQRKRQ